MTDRDPTTRDNRSSFGWLLALIVIVALVAAAFAFGFIKVDQTREAQAPEFDVSTGKVDVGEREQTVKVPTVDVGSTDTQVTVPTVSVEPAEDPEK